MYGYNYQDLMADLDDRDDQYDPEYRQDDHYCGHGTYIGHPFGADFMCGWCEDGISVKEMHEILAAQAAERRRSKTRSRLALRLAVGMEGHKLADFWDNETIKRLFR